MKNDSRRRGGFTLIELLVVIAIIIIIATVSLVALSGAATGARVKEGGRVTKSAFTKARQLASSRRETHFLVFTNATDPASGLATGRIEVHRDRNGDRAYQSASDPIDGEAITLLKGLVFRFQPPNANPQGAWIAFLPDGSIPSSGVFASGDVSGSAYDAAFASGTMGASADLVIEASNGAPGRVFLDVALPSGQVRKIAYFE